MFTTPQSALVALALLALTPLALAQDTITNAQAELATAEDTAWAEQLLGRAHRARRVQFDWTTGGAVPLTLPVEGVEAMARGARARLLSFESPRDAVLYAGQTQSNRPNRAQLLEVRGNQVLELSGDTVMRALQSAGPAAKALQRLRARAWEGVSDAEPAVVAVKLGEGPGASFAVDTLASGPLYEAIRTGVQKANARTEERIGATTLKRNGADDFTFLAPGLTSTLSLGDGFGRSVVATGSDHAKTARLLSNMLKELIPSDPAQAVKRPVHRVGPVRSGALSALEAALDPATDVHRPGSVGNGGEPIGATRSGDEVFQVSGPEPGTWEYRVGSPQGPLYDRAQDGVIR